MYTIIISDSLYYSGRQPNNDIYLHNNNYSCFACITHVEESDGGGEISLERSKQCMYMLAFKTCLLYRAIAGRTGPFHSFLSPI